MQCNAGYCFSEKKTIYFVGSKQGRLALAHWMNVVLHCAINKLHLEEKLAHFRASQGWFVTWFLYLI